MLVTTLMCNTQALYKVRTARLHVGPHTVWGYQAGVGGHAVEVAVGRGVHGDKVGGHAVKVYIFSDTTANGAIGSFSHMAKRAGYAYILGRLLGA